MGFKNKVAIITGAGQGIGFEICRRLAEEGAHIFLNDVDGTLATKAADQITATGGSCVACPGDSSSLPFIQQMIDNAVGKHGKLDIVVANAGITLFANFFEYTSESFYRVLEVNMGGTFFMAQKAALQMKTQAGGGSMLFMSSVVGHQAHKNLGAYAMTKAAIEMLAKNLVEELSEFNINVNTVAPGATLTERTQEDASYKATWSRITPMGRPATVADIAEAVLFLVSDKAKHITGQSLVVDGGWTSVSPSPY